MANLDERKRDVEILRERLSRLSAAVQHINTRLDPDAVLPEDWSGWAVVDSWCGRYGSGANRPRRPTGVSWSRPSVRIHLLRLRSPCWYSSLVVRCAHSFVTLDSIPRWLRSLPLAGFVVEVRIDIRLARWTVVGCLCALLGLACQSSSDRNLSEPGSRRTGPIAVQEEHVSEPLEDTSPRPAWAPVSFEQDDHRITVLLSGKPFTAFHFGDEWNKPFLHPLRTSSGTVISREYPAQPRPSEKRDYDWHGGISYGHGDLNGHDFWGSLGGDKTGVVVPLFEPVFEGGAERGLLVAEFGFQTPDGRLLGNAFHRYTFSQLGHLILIDAVIAIRANQGQSLRFGDTEGGFAMSLSDDFREDRGAVLLNSDGRRGSASIWGQSARWVDYSAIVSGKWVGVALLDHPSNLRHPARWYARAFGLCTASLFGLGNFTGDNAQDGTYTLPRGETLRFGYRVIIHEGRMAAEEIERLYADFATRRDP